MRRIAGVAWVVSVAAIVGAQFVRPARTNPPTDSARTLAASRPMPSAVSAALERGCRDCHSNETRWPWYSNVAPISWFVIDHVNHGRSHFNYSDWSRYDAQEASRLLTNACRLAREKSMPIRSYTWMHRDARLNESDIEALCTWTSPPSPRNQ